MQIDRWLPFLLFTAIRCPMVVGECSIIVGPCNKQNIIANECGLVGSLDDAQVEQLCAEGAFSFKEVSSKLYQKDQNYMDGGSALNNQNLSTDDAGRINRFRGNFHSHRKLAWPQYDALEDYSNIGGKKVPYMDNFNLTDSCQLKTAMCCFAEAPSFNSQVCHHDLSQSRKSSHIYRGYATFSEQQAYCVGFSWNTETEDDYKGNLLMDISYNNLVDHGMKKNIPGAPMCGCVEKMPAVTQAACRTVSVTGETYTLAPDMEGGLVIVQTGGTITFGDCPSGDLLSSYSGPNRAELSKKLVGSCNNNAFLNHRFYVPGTNSVYSEPDPSKWKKMMGQGIDYVPHKGDLTVRDIEFRAQFALSPNKIVYRLCRSCQPSHQHIYYRRLTELPSPPDFNFINLLMNAWVNTNNELGTDFELYSTYEDALAGTNGWTYCNYNSRNVGFPCDCGPTKAASCQFNSHVVDPCRQDRDFDGSIHAFYIELP